MIKFFNRLTRKKQIFDKPKTEAVTMYSCGPTVYYYQHIGNMRAYVFMDLIRRTLKYNGYKINGAMNITDVGHLTSDEDSGDDKMIVASKKENKTPWEIAKFYTDIFFGDIAKLNIEKPEHILKATDHIQEMIEFVEELLKKGHAYETENGIYFDVQSFKSYGALSGIPTERRLSGARVEVDENKKHPADFALWIKAPKEHIMQWQSPWGMGYPGWHIECSAMGTKYLGTDIDIHTGGIDHVTVHHENEIAQNNCRFDKEVVKFWMELEFLQIDGGKMSKSLGNIYTLDDLAKRGYQPLDYRYFLLNAHYLKMQNFTFEALSSAKESLSNLRKLIEKHKNGTEVIDSVKIENYKKKFLSAINDDINAPLALGVLWAMLKSNKPSKEVFETALKFDEVLGLSLGEDKQEEDVPTQVKELAEQRWEAKLKKDFAKADSLRVEISNLGYTIFDNKDGYKISRS